MRVVLGTTTTNPGGVWRHMEELMAGLREQDVDVVLGLIEEAEPLHRAAAAKGLPWEPLPSVMGRGHLLHLHLHDTYEKRAMKLLAQHRARGGRSVATEHLPRTNASDPSLWWSRSRPGAIAAKRAFKRAEYALCSKVISVSDGSGRFLRTAYALPPDKLRVVCNGVRPSEPAPGPQGADGPLRALMLGNLVVQKGADVLVGAAAQAQEHWVVDVYGDGPHRDKLERQAREQADGRVRFHGWRDDGPDRIGDFNVICMPSRWESCPYAALEAMARARPVVGTRVDGLEDIIEHESTGLLVAPDDPGALAVALDDLASRRAELPLMGTAAQIRVRERFSFDAMVAGTRAVYEEASC